MAILSLTDAAAYLGVKNARELALPGFKWRPHGDSNPGYRRERAVELVDYDGE